jgi:hypothetical protein
VARAGAFLRFFCPETVSFSESKSSFKRSIRTNEIADHLNTIFKLKVSLKEINLTNQNAADPNTT